MTESQPCKCDKKPVVVEDTESGEWHVGCRSAFFARQHGEAECKDRVVVVAQPSREVAVAAWNTHNLNAKES